MKLVQKEGPRAKVRPDMRVAFMRDFDTPEQRLDGTRTILRTLVGIAEKKAA